MNKKSPLTEHLVHYLLPTDKTYSGQITSEMLFMTPVCESFKCRSGRLLSVSPEMKIKMAPLQMQAFNFTDREYGKNERNLIVSGWF